MTRADMQWYGMA